MMTKKELSMQTLIEHYQPPSFPIEPIVTNKTVQICRDSWQVRWRLKGDLLMAGGKSPSASSRCTCRPGPGKWHPAPKFTNTLCTQVIKTQERKGVSGVVYFYDEFYKRLFDRSEAFNSFFSGDMKKKGQVLIRIMEFLTTIDMDAPELFYLKCEGLAKVHSKRTIRPWQYSVFIETVIITVSGPGSPLLLIC
jgi:hypothetical protein